MGGMVVVEERVAGLWILALYVVRARLEWRMTSIRRPAPNPLASAVKEIPRRQFALSLCPVC